MPGFEESRRQLQREIDAGIVAGMAHPSRARRIAGIVGGLSNAPAAVDPTCAECGSADLSLGTHDQSQAVCAACGAVQAV